MTHPGSSPLGSGGIRPNSATNPEAPLPKREASIESGPAFRALLEKLEDQARGVRSQQGVEHPDELAGAADAAKAAVTDALQLRDQLLEAYRATQQRGGDPDAG